MPIEVQCQSCGKVLKAKESAAGKKAKCPQCGEVLQIPEAVYDAEEDWGDTGGYDDDDYGTDDAYGFDMSDVRNAPADVDSNRKPCPMCGEMIVVGAAKCRYCGEVFDPKLKKKTKARSGAHDDDSDLSTGDWVLAILCSGIGCIIGIVWMIQGKPKGGKMVGISFLASIFWNILRAALEVALRQNQM